MEIVGYVDRFIARAGDIVRCMVSATVGEVDARLVRLIHGDTSAGGPGFKEVAVPSAIDGTYAVHEQRLETGSYMDAPSLGLPRVGPLSMVAWVRPSLPGRGPQSILSWSSEHGLGIRLILDREGALAFGCGGDDGKYHQVSTSRPLRAGEWYRVAAVVSDDASSVTLQQEPRDTVTGDPTLVRSTHSLEGVVPGLPEVPTVVGAAWKQSQGASRRTTDHFNGKIEAPEVYAAALDLDDLDSAVAEANTSAVIAAWDFSIDVHSFTVHDTGPNSCDGMLINMPARAVTGHNWNGTVTSWREDPSQYGAIYFHDTDLEDPGWEETFSLELPGQLRSGVYAFRIRGGGHEDHVPFIVETPPGQAKAKVALLLPTMTYSIYANASISWQNPFSPASFPRIIDRLLPEDRYITKNRLKSAYDLHSDESLVLYTSLKRPLLDMRPRYRVQLINSPHQLGADLYIVDWLEALGYDYDVITDDAVHQHGLELLDAYRVVLTGSHPEYTTTPMWDALHDYVRRGGRLMYLGGNGFYWVVAVHPERPHVRELRRGYPADAEPGEEHHSTTGERGGLWRRRGRPPQRLVGVGYSGEGYDHAVPYRRLPDSFDPRVAFIFEGIGDELIGDFGLVMGGAGGFEIDRCDPERGTPPQALRLATTVESFSHSYTFNDVVNWRRSQYQAELEARYGPPEPGEAVRYYPGDFGSANPLLRADMTFCEHPGGGATFSTGSIAWTGALSFNGYRNNVSRITDNVLRRFASEEGFAP